MNFLRQIFVAFLLVLSLVLMNWPVGAAWGQDDNYFLSEEFADSEQAPINKDTYFSVSAIRATWDQLVFAIQRNDIAKMRHYIGELAFQRDVNGFYHLEEYSLSLLQFAEESILNNQETKTIILTQGAHSLSPRNAAVLLQSINVAELAGYSSTFALFLEAGLSVFNHPRVFVEVVVSSLYWLLWAMTFGLLISLLLYLAFNIGTIFTYAGKKLPVVLKGWLTPLITLTILLVPLFFGPLWCVAVWSILVVKVLHTSRVVGVYSALVIALWGVLIPFKEGVQVWLYDHGGKIILNTAHGAYSDDALKTLEKIASDYPESGAVHFLLAQTLRKEDLLERADTVLERAHELLGEREWIVAEQAAIAFLKGDLELADQLYERSHELGLSSPAYYFNRSKIKFQLVQPGEAEQLYREAIRLDPFLAESMRQQENRRGADSKYALADVRLPLTVVLQSAEQTYNSIGNRADVLVSYLMFKMSPKLCIGFAIFLAIFILFGNASKQQATSYYRTFQPGVFLKPLKFVFPGAKWLWANKLLTGLFIITSFCLLFLPVIGWPYMPHFSFKWPHPLFIPSLITIGILWIVTLWLSATVRKKDPIKRRQK